MTIEESVFKRKVLNKDKLEVFGFLKKSDQSYVYQTKIMDDSFLVQVSIDARGNLSSRVLDLDMDEDYLAIHLEKTASSYVRQVQAAYRQVLEEIAVSCFSHLPFLSDQMNRLHARLQEEFGDLLDRPFETASEYQSYRVAGKWYALIYPLDLDKLEGIEDKYKGQRAEVVNLKVKPAQLDALLDLEGIYPAYHMSKKSWVTLILDDTLSDSAVWDLLFGSRALVAPAILPNPNGPDYWVIPANLKYYDIDSEFAANSEILWTQKASIKAGDFVFIYITAPTKALRYACRVLEANIPNQGYRDRDGIETLMKLQLLQQYEDHLLPLDLLQEQGLKSVRGPRRLPPQLVAFLQEKGYFKE